MTTPDMIKAALWYVSNGFKIFPLNGKVPATPHGFKDATQIQIRVRELWAKDTNANIGLCTEGLIALDFDTKHDGLQSKADIETVFGSLPKTRVHKTGSGGEHWLYKQRPGEPIKNTTSLGGYPGVDVRGNGGYIVAPPSLHPNGNRYEIIDKSPITECPEWLSNLAREQNTTTLTTTDSGEVIAEDGNRNATLTSLAGTMRRKGLGQSAITAALLEANKTQCNPPLSDKEVEEIAKSVSRYQPSKDPINRHDPLKDIPQDTDFLDITDETDIPHTGTDKTKKLKNTDKTEPTDETLTNVSQQKRDHLVWKMVDWWLSDHRGEKFDLDTICRQLAITDRDSRHSVSKKLFYEVKQEKLEKSDRIYRYIDKEITYIDFINIRKKPPLSIKWPYGYEDQSRFGFDGFIQIPPAGVIMVSGVSNTGKTAFIMNFLALNMDDFPCTLMGNEYEGSSFSDRWDEISWANPAKEDGTPKFELIERYRDWKDIIRPGNINIIDWVSLDGVAQPFYYIGEIAQGVRAALKGQGCAVVCIQKESGKEYGMGGGFGQHLASLYLNIDFNPDKSLRMTVKKAKIWSTHNPNGEIYTFNLSKKGTLFSEIRTVKKCHACFGRGEAKNGGTCIECGGSGYIDA